ncbi:MAG: hypothetical protein IT374_12745 [Polyangiaceae bacterium]|nr:hypothetical protein [Polyangiaceae bacterium]
MSRPSPLLGFNNNLRYKGQVFHVQTEDSGVRHPHVITHLFMDGGRILKTTKTSYADHVGQPGFADHVKALMKEQHRAMFRTLKAGDLDELIAQKSPSAARPTEPALGAAAAPPDVAPTREAGAAPAEAPGPEPHADAQTASTTAAEGDASGDDEELTSSEIRMADAIERAAAEADAARGAPGLDDLPPPPSVGAPRVELSGYRVVSTEPRSKGTSERPQAKPPRPHPPSSSKFAVGRPVASAGNPAAFFGADAPAADESLDDVILGYLADDLGPPKPR